MSTLAKVLLGFGGIFILSLLTAVVGTIGLNNSLVAQEEGIVAQYKQNQNNYDNMWKRFKEMSQVPQMYTDDMKKVYDSAIKNRYGMNGSRAMFQWIKEHNPNFDSSMYKKLQTAIEAGRISFAADQKMLLDKRRAYKTRIRQFPGSIVASVLGFPTINLDEYDIITSDDTEKAFKDKKADEVKLR